MAKKNKKNKKRKGEVVLTPTQQLMNMRAQYFNHYKGAIQWLFQVMYYRNLFATSEDSWKHSEDIAETMGWLQLDADKHVKEVYHDIKRIRNQLTAIEEKLMDVAKENR